MFLGAAPAQVLTGQDFGRQFRPVTVLHHRPKVATNSAVFGDVYRCFGAMLANIVTICANSGEMFANFGRLWPFLGDFDRFGAISIVPILGEPGQFRSISADFQRCWPNLGRLRTMSGDLAQFVGMTLLLKRSCRVQKRRLLV